MPEWMTPLLWPLWWRAISGSFSSTARRSWGKRRVASMAVAKPTIPPPITRRSKLCCGISEGTIIAASAASANCTLLHDQRQVGGVAHRARGGGYGEDISADGRGGVGWRHDGRRAAAIATATGAKNHHAGHGHQGEAEQDSPAMPAALPGEDESGNHGQKYRCPPESAAAPPGNGSYYGAGEHFQSYGGGARAWC